MPGVYDFWDGDEWEQFAHKLLQDRHGPLNVQKVPAKHKGDCGLDFYCLGEGVVYQCYAAEPTDVADRAKKQKNKITADLGKFTDPAKGATTILKGHEVHRWVLVVPVHDSHEVNKHATRKGLEARSNGHAHVADDFEVLIQDITDFDQSSLQARARQRAEISLSAAAASSDEVEAWSARSGDLVQNLERKLGKRAAPSDPVAHKQLVDEAIQLFLERENALEALRRDAPELHEEISQVIALRDRRLRFLGPSSTGTASQIMAEQIDEFVSALREKLPNLSAESAENLAYGTVSDWLMRCPLDFPPYGDA